MPGAEPFFSEGSDSGCLLFHVFTTTPQEMRRLARFLGQCGFTVNGALPAGHGTSVPDFGTATWRDWYDSAYSGWQRLSSCYTRVFAIGLSLGGRLVLHLVAHISLHGVVAMATPLVLRRKWLWLARILKRMTRYRKKRRGGIQDSEALVDRVAYAHEPTGNLEQPSCSFGISTKTCPMCLFPHSSCIRAMTERWILQ